MLCCACTAIKAGMINAHHNTIVVTMLTCILMCHAISSCDVSMLSLVPQNHKKG